MEPAARAAGVRRRWIGTALATIAALVIVVWFSRPSTIAQVAESIGWSGAFVILALYLIMQVLRTARIWCALSEPERPRFGTVFAIVAIHQCLNHLLPLRLGEVGFPFLMKRYGGVPAANAISLLLVVRLQELLVLALLFAGAVVTHIFFSINRLPASWLIAVAVMAAIALAALFWSVPLVLARSSARIRRLQSFPGHIATKVRLADFLDRLRTQWTARVSPARRALAWLLTVAIWMTSFFASMEALRFGGFRISYAETILGSTIASLSHVLPVNAFGSFGSLEAGWTFGFAMLGFEAKGILAVGFVLHLLTVFFLAALSLLAWVSLPRANRAEGTTAES
ncbi:MAG: flippase-like domain-containing protein [Chthoniobacterales bacterium]|nr:flippase-like domain-containing protein [Chthoniobacterales bacterium]